MAISATSSVETSMPDLRLEQGLVMPPSQSDTDLFSSAMQPQPTSSTDPLSDWASAALSKGLESSDKLSQQALRSFQKVAASGDPTDISKLTHDLATFSHVTALTTKVIKNGTQAIDKLTNLQ
jgi:hypothetical protein